jgi:peptidoglycan/xylan/chitin deacetylase (PgdA/CDA1 family)
MSAPAKRIRRPRSAHWFLVSLLALACAAGLLLQGWAHNDIGKASTASEDPAAASVAPGTGSVIYRDGRRLTSRGLPDRTVALTFDDGPDPTWTPQVLEVLRREHVPGTFFDVGSRVAAHPEIVRRQLADGHEVGSHTFTHASLSAIAGWQENLELSMTARRRARPPSSARPTRRHRTRSHRATCARSSRRPATATSWSSPTATARTGSVRAGSASSPTRCRRTARAPW